MIRCQDYTELLVEELDGALPSNKRAGMWMHRAICRHCRRYGRQIRTLIALEASLVTATEDPTLACPEPLKQTLLDAYRDAHRR